MRALFILSSQNTIYGASRSVGYLIRNLDADIDIIFPIRKNRKDYITMEQVRAFYGDRVKKIWFLPQPFRWKTFMANPQWKVLVKARIKDILYTLALPQYRKIYEQGHYDFIHVNSVVLYPMLDKRWPMILHVREFVLQERTAWDAHLDKKLQEAHGIVYIGEGEKKACPAPNVPQIVRVNPFDQTCVESVDDDEARKRFGLTGDETVYAIIGNIYELKGVRFVIEAFVKAKLDKAVLLVVGQDGNHDEYERKLHEDFDNHPQIRFLGELKDMSPVYRVLDYVVRGDNVAGLGRTSYESLYSGGGAITTGIREEMLPYLDLPEELKDNISFYPIRDEEKLIETFRKTNGKRFESRKYYSNVPAYVEDFKAFIKTTCKEHLHEQ